MSQTPAPSPAAPPAPPKPGVVVIDGREVPYTPGQTVIQAAHAAGIDVPHYCYHPGLSIAGNCRICMVEVEGSPKPQVSCKMACADGLKVRTQSELAKAARAGVMEMLLVNHPLDCPICDQAGECHLQEYSFAFGQGATRSSTDKTHAPKNVPFGSKVVYDGERCIKCTLCVRFMDEVAGTHELAMGQRSDHELVIMTAKGEFSTPYAMNIIDLCPVGALTSRDFRFKSRLWFMDFTPSVCTGCARGCNVTAGARTARLLRLEPRYHADVNRWWMCDAGRLGTGFVNSPTRLAAPRVKKDGVWADVTPEQALVEAGARLRGQKGDVLLDGNLSLEEMLLAKDLAGALKGAARFAAATGKDGDALLVVDEKGANARGAGALGLQRATAPSPALVLLVERDTNVPQALRDATGAKVVFASDSAHVPASAEVVFPLPTFVEKDGWLVNCDGRVQALVRSPQAGPQGLVPAVEVLDELLLEAGSPAAGRTHAEVRSALRALPALAGLAWTDIDAPPPPAATPGVTA
ncbi:MAG: 2Fe-2S iron-sulfur cluster-binding protein [Planctomycetia bacterium]